MVLALWDREKLAEDSGLELGSGFGGVTLAYNVGSPPEVDAIIAEAAAAGATVTRTSRDLLGRLLGRDRGSRRTSLGGCTQPALRCGARRHLDAPGLSPGGPAVRTRRALAGSRASAARVANA